MADVSTLLSDLGSMLNSSLLSDLTVLTSDGPQISAHGCILAARCPGFREAVLTESALPRMLDLSEFAHSAVLAYLEGVYHASHSTRILDQNTRTQLENISTK